MKYNKEREQQFLKWYLELANQEYNGRTMELQSNITHIESGRGLA